MASTASSLVDVGKDLLSGEFTGELRPLYSSFMGELEHSPTGQALKNVWRSLYEPTLKKESASLTAPVIQQFKSGAITKDAAIEAVSEAQRTAQKSVRAKVFGNKDELIPAMLKKMQAEGGIAHANNVADNLSMMFSEKSGNFSSWRLAARKAGVELKNIESPIPRTANWEKNTREAFSWMLLGRIGIPHLAQVLNMTANSGISSSIKALAEYARDPVTAGKAVQEVGAFEEEWIHSLKDYGWFRKFFHQPGFNYIRQSEIKLSALAGKHSAMSAAKELLENPASKAANIQLRHLGLNPESIMEAGKLSDNDISTAMYRSAADSMFFRSAGGGSPVGYQKSEFMRPIWWYKDFIFNQSRFMKEIIKRDFRKSPADGLKTIAWIATAFPLMGELVHSLENAATLNDPTKRDQPIADSEYVDALAHSGAAAMAYSIMKATKRNGLMTYFAGPLYGSTADLFQDAVSGRGREFARTAIMKAGPLGPAAANILVPKQKQGRKKKSKIVY